jgi:biopolymer transport protein ExbD
MATLTAPSGNRKRLPAIDMTPMVDLAFLLLTFFVLTTTLSDPWVLKLSMPEKVTNTSPQPPINANRVLTLVLDQQNKVHWYVGTASEAAETTDFSNNGIRKVLLDKKRNIKDLYVLIKPSDRSQYKNVVDILDEMIITEMEHFAIVDMEGQDKLLIARN